MAKLIYFNRARFILISAVLIGEIGIQVQADITKSISSAVPSKTTNAFDIAHSTSTEIYQKPQPLHKTYMYQADRYRDPFIPLIGAETRTDNNDRAPQITSLILKGIIQDNNGRMAVLTNGANSFILKGGRLYDPHNKVIRGISGVVKSNSVMLIGSDRTVKELRIVRPPNP